MSKVNTTFGKIDADDLGAVNVHEHVILDGIDNNRIPEDFNHIETEKIACELIQWKDAGGGVIVDSSPIGAGRNIDLLEVTSQSARLPLIAASGFHKLSYYPEDHWVFTQSEEFIYEILFEECTNGILIDDRYPGESERSAIKAGILKIGADPDGITPVIDKILTAVSKTMEKTDVNCMIHTEPGVPFENILRELERNQIPPRRIFFCHMGKSLDPNLHQSLAGEGYYLEFDEMIRSTPGLPELARAILDLAEKGYGESILFAGDMARRSYWQCLGGKPGLKYLMTGLHDDLVKLGFTDDLLEEIWIKNPRNFFSGD